MVLLIYPTTDSLSTNFGSRPPDTNQCMPVLFTVMNIFQSLSLQSVGLCYFHRVFYLLYLSFTSGIVPDSLKLENVIPIYKKVIKPNQETIGLSHCTLLKVFDKIWGKLMWKRLCDFLELHHILYDLQFEFRKHHSTALALMEILDNIYEHLDKREYVIGIHLDLQKAFDIR